MKKKSCKKILLAVTALTFAFGFTCLGAACGSKNGGNDSPYVGEVLGKDVVLELNKTQMNLVLGSSEKLEATYKNGGNEMVVYRSLDESIVTVNRGGVITAVNTGQTTVQASYAGKTATCLVTVGLGEFVPVLQMTAIENNQISVSTADKVNLEGVVAFNGKNYDDAMLSYALSDPSMGTIEDGKFTPAKTGDVTITVSASWRGVTQETTPTLSVGVEVHVIDSVQFFVNDSMVESVTLYSMNIWGGQSFQNAMPFVAKAFINGEAAQTSVSVIGDENLVTWESGVLTAEKVGVGQLQLSCSNGEKEFFIQMPVNVIRPLVEYPVTITNFSFEEDSFDVEEIFGANAVLTEAYQNGEALQVEGNKVLSLQSSNTEKTVTQVTLYTQQAGYTLNVEGYTRIVDTPEEMTALVTNGATITGYNFLDADLTLPELGNEWKDRYFKNGVFDGNGHTLTVTCSDVYKFGLFGNMESATVKNLYIDMTKDFAGALNRDAVLGYQTVGSATFENVSLYLRRKTGDETRCWNNSLVLFYQKTLLNNFVVTLADGVIVTDTSGAEMLVYSDGVNISSKNVYLISPQTITFAKGTCYSSIPAVPETENFSALTQSDFWVYDKTNGALLWKPSLPNMVGVLLNNETTTEIGVSGQETVTVTGAYLDGTLTPTLSIIDGEEFISVENNVITALAKIGKAEVKATYTASGETVEKIITVIVKYPAYTDGIIRLSDITQDAYLPDGLTVVRVTDADGVVYYENGAWDWSKITAPQTAEIGKKTMYVQTDETIWSVQTEIYAGIIQDQEDFKYFASASDDYTKDLTDNVWKGNGNRAWSDVKTRKGYWLLVGNVTVDSGAWGSMWYHRYFENGIFDGNGYTLDITMGSDWSFGIFGDVYNSIIKNVKINITAANGKINGNQNRACLLAYSMRDTILQDCLINVSVTGETTPVDILYLTTTYDGRAGMVNCVINVDDGILNANGYVYGVSGNWNVQGSFVESRNTFIFAKNTLKDENADANLNYLYFATPEAAANATPQYVATFADLLASGWWTYDKTDKTLTFGKANE